MTLRLQSTSQEGSHRSIFRRRENLREPELCLGCRVSLSHNLIEVVHGLGSGESPAQRWQKDALEVLLQGPTGGKLRLRW
ncbi:MAG: hypothetical protein JWL65_7248 [Gammaproteobacteria bacterium]|nr:hypothetical protein [Gammaproteobacteria bacterium]